MSTLSRIGVALDSNLLQRFDRYIAAQGYDNRSEAFRDLIRDRLSLSRLQSAKTFVVGTVTLIYDHHSRLLPEKLMELQHQFHPNIISTVHSHLDHDTCLEVVVVKGHMGQVQELADRLIGIKGVQHGKLVVSSPDAYLPQAKPAPHDHPHTHRHPR
jgi:CopG family transcriptional regulator, nickel-responsive regulator